MYSHPSSRALSNKSSVISSSKASNKKLSSEVENSKIATTLVKKSTSSYKYGSLNSHFSTKGSRLKYRVNKLNDQSTLSSSQSRNYLKGNGHGEGLPQTGEAAATAVIGFGVALIVVSGVVIWKKKNH